MWNRSCLIGVARLWRRNVCQRGFISSTCVEICIRERVGESLRKGKAMAVRRTRTLQSDLGRTPGLQSHTVLLVNGYSIRRLKEDLDEIRRHNDGLSLSWRRSAKTGLDRQKEFCTHDITSDTASDTRENHFLESWVHQSSFESEYPYHTQNIDISYCTKPPHSQ